MRTETKQTEHANIVPQRACAMTEAVPSDVNCAVFMNAKSKKHVWDHSLAEDSSKPRLCLFLP